MQYMKKGLFMDKVSLIIFPKGGGGRGIIAPFPLVPPGLSLIRPELLALQPGEIFKFDVGTHPFFLARLVMSFTG